MSANMRTLDEFWVHDPFILPRPETGEYLLYSASKEAPIVQVFTSTDLRHWSEPREVFRVPEDSWADPASGPWAPEVHEHGGRFHLLTTLHDPRRKLPEARSGGTAIRAGALDGRHDYEPVPRGTIIAVADTPFGPFELVDPAAPVPPADFMTLDGTLFVDDDGRPWMVYAHEWVQVMDGTMEAVPLAPDLSRADGDPILLFRASQAKHLDRLTPGTVSTVPYVSDGPQLRRLPGGALHMLWATYDHVDGGTSYVETAAISRSGALAGPWEQLDLVVDGNAGHGMSFEAFDGTLLLVLHRGMGTPHVRAELHELAADADGLRVVRRRTDLDSR